MSKVSDEQVEAAQHAYANSGPDKFTRMRAALEAAQGRK